MFNSIKMLSFVSVFFASAAWSAPTAMKMDHSLNLATFEGSTFLDVVRAEQDGVKAHLDGDFEQVYKVANWAKVNAALANFDKKVVGTVLKAFPNGKDGLKEMVDQMAGKKFTPANMVGVIRANYSGSGNIFALAHFIAMASGAGTVVHIDENNYFYNFGYKSGSEADDVKSGRSYGAGPKHPATDASDIFYLTELEEFLTEKKDIQKFYEVFLAVLTKTDVSHYGELSDLGQTVETDLIAIYTAELDRHLMVELNPSNHPWENDLAEATFLSVFNAKTGLMYKEGALAKGPLKDFWAKSTVSNRSGIGITRNDRRELQRKVSAYMRSKHPALIAAVEKVTGGGRRDGDVFRGLMEFLNNASTQEKVARDADKISKSFVNLLMKIDAEAPAIARSL